MVVPVILGLIALGFIAFLVWQLVTKEVTVPKSCEHCPYAHRCQKEGKPLCMATFEVQPKE